MVDNNISTAAANKAEVVRPTEAQLRWAQFHKKKRARETKEKVLRLYQTPLSPSAVDGALSDDAKSSSDESCESSDIVARRLVEKRKLKPKISKGRRAMLKVSKRAFRERHQTIEKNGFQCWGDADEFDKENEADFFGELLSDESFKKHRKRRQSRLSRGLPQPEDVERMQRFEAAYAMMLTMKSQQQPIVIRSTKRWTRPQNISAAVSIDGKSFEDWKWGLARKKRTANRQPRLANMPFDRRASWLVHLPVQEKRRQTISQSISSDGEYIQPIALYGQNESLLMSPQRLKFDEMVARLHCNEHMYPGQPLPDQNSINVSARYLDNLPVKQAVGSPRIIRRQRRSAENQLENPHQLLGRPSRAMSAGSDLIEPEDSSQRLSRQHSVLLGAIPESHIPSGRHGNDKGTGKVKTGNFESHGHSMEYSFGAVDENQDGELIQTGRLSAAHSTGTSSIGMDSIGGPRVFFAPETDGHGKVQKAGRVSAAYSVGATSLGEESDFFAEARRQNSRLNLEEGDDGTSRFSDSSIDDRALYVLGNKSGLSTKAGRLSGNSSNSNDHLEEGSDQKLHQEAANYSESGAGIFRPGMSIGDFHSEGINAIESLDSFETPRSKSRASSIFDETTPNEQVGETPPSLLKSSSLRVGARVASGILNMVTGRNTEEDKSSEVKAFEAFKTRQDERRENKSDDATSTSSFRVLPDGLRRMVKGFSSRVDVGEEGGSEGDRGMTNSHASEIGPSGLASNIGAPSPNRSISSAGNSGFESVSPEHGRLVQQNVMKSSALIGDAEADLSVIDTDETTSDASGAKMNPREAAALLLSPAILAKRLQQAIRSVEKQNWEQAAYLVSANPWLAEMIQSNTQQYLLHKVALHGASRVLWSEEEDAYEILPSAPEKLNQDLLHIFPSSVHKFDQEGNLPLHMAAASGNLGMIVLLGERFPGGASVRNNDGMLPLHLAIQACASPIANEQGDIIHGGELIEALLRLFPAGITVTDNEGDLPLHIAGAALEGEVGVDIIYLLLDEADRQAKEGNVLKFSDKFKVKKVQDDNESVSTDTTETPTDSSNVASEVTYCTLARNEMGRTPLAKAIEAGSGWEVIEALARGPGGDLATLIPDVDNNNALHNLVTAEFGDPQAALSILKVAPQTANVKNTAGMLPIEIACQQGMPREVIIAMVLVDLPMDLNDKGGAKIRQGCGGSWWFLTCECDDHFVDIVEEIVSICSYQHLRELCFMKGNGNAGPVISRATPQCRALLRKALRFVGRFEFLGSTALYVDDGLGLKVFDALDFGREEVDTREGKRVLLNCYSKENEFLQDTAIVRKHNMDNTYIEELFEFAVHEMIGGQEEARAPKQWCVAIDRPNLTLDKVVEGMQRNEEYRYNEQMRTKYLGKVCMVLRLVAKGLRHLHQQQIVHGDICLENCGKFGDKWKIISMIGSQEIGHLFAPSRMGESSPPEAVGMLHDITETRSTSSRQRATLVSQLEAQPSIDAWAFGKLAFESLTGQALIQFDPTKDIRLDNRALLTLMNWGESNLRSVVDSLRTAGISNLGADLITFCLLPNPDERPKTMDEIIDHPFWKDMKRKKSSATGRQQPKQKLGREPRYSLHEA